MPDTKIKVPRNILEMRKWMNQPCYAWPQGYRRKTDSEMAPRLDDSKDHHGGDGSGCPPYRGDCARCILLIVNAAKKMSGND